MDRLSLLARLEANAVTADLISFALESGDQITMRKLTQDEMLRVVTSAGNDLDADARKFTSSLRWCLIDDDGNHLLTSYAEASAFVNTLTGADFAAMRDAVEKAMPADDDDVEVVEAGKAS